MSAGIVQPAATAASVPNLAPERVARAVGEE